MRKALALAAIASVAIPAALSVARADSVHVAVGYGPPPGVVTYRYYRPVWRPAPMVLRIETIADQVMNDAALTRFYAERGRHHFDWREERAIRSLYDLDAATRDFHDAAELATRQPYGTYTAYLRLSAAYDLAARNIRGLHAYAPVMDLWLRVSDGMAHLAGCYDPAYHGVAFEHPRGGYGSGYGYGYAPVDRDNDDDDRD